QEPVLLGSDEVEGEGDGGEHGADTPRDLRSRAEEQDEAEHAEEDGGSEVGLGQEQEGEEADDEGVGEEADGEGADLLLLPGQRARQVDHDGELGQLRRLEAQAPDADPTPRTTGQMTDTGDEDEDEGDQREQ